MSLCSFWSVIKKIANIFYLQNFGLIKCLSKWFWFFLNKEISLAVLLKRLAESKNIIIKNCDKMVNRDFTEKRNHYTV